MPYIETEEVESSNIERIGYHKKQQILRIVFHGGRAYDYPMVTAREYKELMAAESKGKFFNSRIKPMYAHRTPRDVELAVPCCEHPEPNPTCTKECFPCNEWCCPGASSGCGSEEIAAAIKDGMAFGAADHSASPKTGSDEGLLIGGDMETAEVPPAVPRKENGEIDMDAIPDASHLFQAGEDGKACLHPEQDREERLDGSGAACGACGADLSQSGDCPHGADGRDCEEGCGCIPCHQSIKDACSDHPDGCPADGHAAPLPAVGAPVDTSENPEEKTNGNPD